MKQERTLLSVLLWSLAAAGSLFAADVVTMKNGDRLTGSVVKKDAKNLVFKSDIAGPVTIPWEQVATVSTDSAVTVAIAGGETVLGTVATNPDKSIEIKSGGASKTVLAEQVSTIRNAEEQAAYERLLAPRLTDLWVIGGNINFAGTSGNAKTNTFTIPVSAHRITNSDKTSVYFNFISASATVNNQSAATARAVRGGWAYNRNLTSRLFLNLFNDYEYDRFQNLDLRVVLGSGLGYGVWKSERGRFDLVGGAAWNREKFDPIRPDLPFVRNAAEAYWGDDLTLSLNSRLSFFQGYRMFNNLSKSERYRQNFDAGLTAKLTKWLTWNATISDRYLNSPVTGRKKNDFLYSTGFGFSFTR
ncbi:MAG: DUF481 domain-containing protein [Bryobacteraceae bacterium]